MERERVGSRFKRKRLQSGLPFLLSNLLRHKKEQQSHSQGHLERGEKKGGYRTAFFVSELQFFTHTQRVVLPVFTLLLD